jgi:hypothetical protein
MREMQRKVAMLIRERQEEGLRMALGITLQNDIIDIYVLDRKVDETEKNKLNLETVSLMNMNLFTNSPENDAMTCLSNEEISERLIDYDHIIVY